MKFLKTSELKQNPGKTTLCYRKFSHGTVFFGVVEKVNKKKQKKID